MAILTISQEMGSGGAEIGMAVATRLGYTYVDQEELLGRAKRYGLAEDRLARLAEDRPSWVERFDAETRRCILALQVVLYEFAQDDNVVLMGGGGQWLLRGLPHVLRSRIVAPFPVRVTRLTATLSGQGKERVTPKTVAQFIRRDDIQKAARMRYLFDAEVKDPSLYDLLINTAVLSREAAVGLLSHLLPQIDEKGLLVALRRLVVELSCLPLRRALARRWNCARGKGARRAGEDEFAAHSAVWVHGNLHDWPGVVADLVGRARRIVADRVGREDLRRCGLVRRERGIVGNRVRREYLRRSGLVR